MQEVRTARHLLPGTKWAFDIVLDLEIVRFRHDKKDQWLQCFEKFKDSGKTKGV